MASRADKMASNINFSNFGQATDLKNRIWFTIGALIVFRLLSFVPLPGVDPIAQAALYANNAAGGVLDIFNTFSGGSLERMSLIALGVMPYITRRSWFSWPLRCRQHSPRSRKRVKAGVRSSTNIPAMARSC